MQRIGPVLVLVLTSVVGLLGPVPPASAQEPSTYRPPFTVLAGHWTFSLHPSTAGKVVSSSKRVLLWANGSATTTVDVPSRATDLRFSARADRCDGGARVEVRVDGVLVLDHEVVGDRTGTYVVKGDWPAGRRHLSFRFTNDRLTADCDRNLHLSDVFVGGPSSEPGESFGSYTRQYLDMGTATFSPASAGRRVRSQQHLGSQLLLWAPGRVRAVLDSHNADRMEIDLWASSCTDPADVRLRVDGELVRRRSDDLTGSRGLLSFEDAFGRPGTWADGTHVVEVELVDDGGTGCDQQVGLTSLAFSGRV